VCKSKKQSLTNKKSLAIILALILVTGVIIVSNFGSAQAISDSKAKKDIIKSIGSAVEGSWSSIEMVNVTKQFVNGTVTVYNKTLGTNVTQKCNDSEHLENGVCVPNTPQGQEICNNGVDDDGDGKVDENCPPIPSDRNHTRVILAGDLLGDSIAKGIKDREPDLFVALGDLGYQPNLNWYRNTFSDLGNRAKCLVGNHDAAEDADSKPITQQAITTCGNSWSVKIANGTTLMLGFNTNGDLNKQLDNAKDDLSNTTFMDGVKSVYVLTHKPCFTHPNSHHTVDEDDNIPPFCNSLATILPQGVKTLYISGHNHEIASTSDGLKFVSGGGGQDTHRDCKTNSTWNFCDTQDGFLEFRIDNKDGSAVWKFLKANGDPIPTD
jgi:hypothetical protein